MQDVGIARLLNQRTIRLFEGFTRLITAQQQLGQPAGAGRSAACDGGWAPGAAAWGAIPILPPPPERGDAGRWSSTAHDHDHRARELLQRRQAARTPALPRSRRQRSPCQLQRRALIIGLLPSHAPGFAAPAPGCILQISI